MSELVPSTAKKLHLGAFDCGLEGWINTDITPHMYIARVPGAAFMLRIIGKMSAEKYNDHRRGRFNNLVYIDLTKPLPYENNSIFAVFSSHVFEHLFLDEVEKLVGEIHRVLIAGGVCRVVVPDLEKVVALFNKEDPRAFLSAIYEAGKRTAMKNSHHCGFTSSFLKDIFEKAGFSRCARTTFRVGACPDIDRLDNRQEESLFFEAIK